MFNSFYSEAPGYIPDNMHKKPVPPPPTTSLINHNLDIILDKHGKKKGYSWNYGETVSLPISVDLPITIEMDAYYTSELGERPTIYTAGTLGQRFYNLVDVKSWTMNSYVPSDRAYNWVEDKVFTFPNNAPKLVYIHPDMKDKYILCEFLNFRGEQIFEKVYKEQNSVSWKIDQELSLKIPRGIYTLMIYVADEHRPELLGREEYKKLTKRYEIVVR